MKADRPLDEVYADIKEILKAWVVWISHLSSYTSIFVHLHFFCPLMHAIETKKLDKAGKNYSAADFLQLSSKIYTNLFIPSNWHKITIRQFERAWVGNALYSVPWVLFELQQPTWNNKPGSAHRPLYFKIARQERELHIYVFILDQPGLFFNLYLHSSPFQSLLGQTLRINIVTIIINITIVITINITISPPVRAVLENMSNATALVASLCPSVRTILQNVTNLERWE